MRNKLFSKAFKASLLKNKKEANGKAFQKVFIVRSLAPRTHYAKIQKYEQGKIGLQFFDMWC